MEAEIEILEPAKVVPIHHVMEEINSKKRSLEAHYVRDGLELGSSSDLTQMQKQANLIIPSDTDPEWHTPTGVSYFENER